MDITDYTSYAEVRSTCGLSVDELPDSEIALEMYANALELSLNDVSVPTEAPGPGPLSSRYLVIAAIVEASRTAKEQQLYNLTRLFSTYAVALEIVTALAMKAPKSISDSKASLVRFSPESVYKDAIERITQKLDDVKNKIENINSNSITSFDFLKAIKPATDRVTGV
jgi:hypothetical protein